MRKYYSIVFITIFCLSFQFVTAQDRDRVPLFPSCENLELAEQKNCFNQTLQTFVSDNFQIPEAIKTAGYRGTVTVLFAVDTEGKAQFLFADAVYPELIQEAKRVIGMLPTLKPGVNNGKPAYQKFTYKIRIPLNEITPEETKEGIDRSFRLDLQKKSNELDSIKSLPFNNPQFTSKLNIPFSHFYYSWFDKSLNQMGTNNHTGSKPYTYAEVSKYFDIQAATVAMKKDRKGWWGRKFWNENFFEFQGKDYWFTLNPFVDLRMGRTNDFDNNSTFQNTRGVQLQGGLGKAIVFTTSIYESQGRFAGFYNAYAESIAPSGGDPAIIPGVGIAKRFKTDSYDFPSAEAIITVTPSDFIDLQLGYGRNFLGDGYRSLLLSDGASPYPFIKVNTRFWKIKYTNTYLFLKDVRPEVTQERTYASKYMANHYLSWNVSNRLNLGFFESVVWTNSNGRGFDSNFINPIIFYRSVEFTSSARSGNAVLGLTAKYKFNNAVTGYGQFILDEFALGDIQEQNKSWRNKYGYQLGVKYFDAFKIKGLNLQAEYNRLRPYVYQHSDPLTNYGHNNQALGHQWGANLEELVLIGRYQKGRYFGEAKLNFGIRGLDFETDTDNFNYGGDPYKNYNTDRPFDTNVLVGQGNKTDLFIGELQAGYIVNPVTNLKAFAHLMVRNFSPETETLTVKSLQTTWFSLGIRADLFNMYFDY